MKIVVLTGAGISAESGIKTFRDADGLWEGHDVLEVASVEGWKSNPRVVQDFYNLRRRQLKEVAPNTAHLAIAELQNHHDVVVITQNVDDLHERAGSENVIHLHGELRKARSTQDPEFIIPWEEDLTDQDVAADGSPLRPHIVWFGEAVPMIEPAVEEISLAESVMIVGTSMQVYPAAGLVAYAPEEAPIYYIDPRPAISYELQRRKKLKTIVQKASIGVPEVVQKFVQKKS